MGKYAVKLTKDALADMEALYEHIAVRLQAPKAAREQYNRIADAILTWTLCLTGMGYLNVNRNILWGYIEL